MRSFWVGVVMAVLLVGCRKHDEVVSSPFDLEGAQPVETELQLGSASYSIMTIGYESEPMSSSPTSTMTVDIDFTRINGEDEAKVTIDGVLPAIHDDRTGMDLPAGMDCVTCVEEADAVSFDPKTGEVEVDVELSFDTSFGEISRTVVFLANAELVKDRRIRRDVFDWNHLVDARVFWDPSQRDIRKGRYLVQGEEWTTVGGFESED